MKFPGVFTLVWLGVHLTIGPLFAQNRAPDRVHLIALMVEFQPDENRFTSGNGTFGAGSIPYLEDPGTNIDALPHNRDYFEAHLEFSKRYFERQANGKLSLSYEVLPEVIRLPHEMAVYSPVGENPDNRPLAELAWDAWSLVANSPELTERIAAALQTVDQVGFVLFHAGIGRDLELTGTILEKTPQDIPSVYLNRESIGRLLNDPGFQGFDLGIGGVRVTNSMIVPRTQSRVGQDISGEDFVIGLSMNGMLTAQIGSFLGLPDLFQTQTGESGIGRFGLMDGAGIFAMNGLFPPELSAWEKVWLGWEEPIVVDPGQLEDGQEVRLNIPAASFREEGAIFKIPVTDSEYFLIENRHRDLEGGGSVWTFQKAGGEIETLNVTNLDTDILTMSLGIDSLFPQGVLIDVSNFDFALHGGADTGEEVREPTPEDRQLNGGILIWHIDESVIQSAIRDPFKGVNDDPLRRGVDLEEADGAQDIGYATSLGFSSIDPTGGAFDFWWSGNDARVITQTGDIQLYENRFAYDTKPDNRTSIGAQSWFSLIDFSGNEPVASVTLKANRAVVQEDPTAAVLEQKIKLIIEGGLGYSDGSSLLTTPIEILDLGDDTASDLGKMAIVAGGTSIWAIPTHIESWPKDVTLPIKVDKGNATSLLAIGKRILASFPSENRVSSYLFNPVSFQFEKEWSATVAVGQYPLRRVESGFVTTDFADWSLELASGMIVMPDATMDLIELRTPELFGVSASISGNEIRIENSGLETSFSLPAAFTEAKQSGKRIELGIIETRSGEVAIYLAAGSHLYRIMDPFTASDLLELTNEAAEFPTAFGDLSGDGRVALVYVSKDSTRLHAVGIQGASLPYFPVQVPDGSLFSGAPLMLDITPTSYGNVSTSNSSSSYEKNPEVLIPVQNNGTSTLITLSAEGKVLPTPKISIGSSESIQMNNKATPGVWIDFEQLITVSPSGLFQLFEFSSPVEPAWSNPLGELPQIGLLSTLEGNETPVQTFTLLNKEEVYNWPNPASEQTRIRFETANRATITLRIMTPSGRVFHSSTREALGGAPEEIELDISSWPSGLYIVQLTATDGQLTERKQFNLAVVN